MQNIKSWWVVKKQQLKTFFNRKSVMLVLQLSLIAVIAFCSFENGIINEIRTILETVNLKSLSNFNKVVSEIVLSARALLEVVQQFNFICIIIEILVAFVLLPVFIVFFVKTLSRVAKEAKQRKFALTKKLTANYQAVYIIQSKFLC